MYISDNHEKLKSPSWMAQTPTKIKYVKMNKF